jgi:hypothetical protein
MKIIATHTNRYGDALQTDDIRVTGGKYPGSTHICVHPDGCRIVHGGPVLEHPVAYCVQHATVIDNFGGSAAERQRMTTELALGEPFQVEGFDGIWMLSDRDQRNLEGDGYKMIPAHGAEPFQTTKHAHAVNV